MLLILLSIANHIILHAAVFIRSVHNFPIYRKSTCTDLYEIKSILHILLHAGCMEMHLKLPIILNCLRIV